MTQVALEMDYSYGRSRTDRFRESNRGSSPDRIDATRRTLGATQMNDSHDYGFDWLGEEYDWEKTRKEEYSKSRREPTDEWTNFGATLKDEYGNARRDRLGQTMKENLGATRRFDHLGGTQRNDLGMTQSYDDDVTRRNGLAGTRRVDLGATGDTRREAFGASAVDRDRGSPYRDKIPDQPSISTYPEVVTSGNYDKSREFGGRFQAATDPVPYDYAVEDNRYAVHGGQTFGPRLWTSLAADKSLMEEWHNMFGQIRKKWTPVPSTRLDDDVTTSKWSADQSSSYSSQRRLNKRALVIIVAVVAVVLIVAAVVPSVMLTMHKDKDEEVYLQYEYEATIKNREFNPDMTNPDSDDFRDIENEFCNQLDENANNSGLANGFDYEGCAVTEIKNGSLIVSFVIVIRTVNPSPTSSQVSKVINMEVDAEQSVGLFLVVNFKVVKETPTVITADKSPVKAEKQFNETCGVNEKVRCVTKHSKCLDDVCKCPDGRIYNATSDTCSTFDCGDEFIIANGSATSNGSQFRSMLNISCADGFELSTNDTVILCLSPSSWLNLPKCIPVECVEFIKPDNSEIDTNSSGRKYGDVIEITCENGYQLDNNISSVTCLANQFWSESPVCQIVTCETFVTPGNASISPDLQQFNFNQNVSVQCDPGFKIHGENSVICLANRTWTEIPTCSPLDCESLAIENAAFEPNNQSYKFYEKVIVDCNEGYTLEGNNTVSCTTNGTWSGLPKCIPIKCDTLEIKGAFFVPSEQPFQYLDNVAVNCNEGYTREGNNTVSCSGDGTWPERPTCIPIICNAIEIANATFKPNKSQFSYGENITINCETGFQLQGSEVFSCRKDGAWKDAPTCDVIVCQLFDIPTNVKLNGVHKPQFPYNTEVTFDCENGYVIKDNATVRCQEDGSWTHLPKCEPITCNEFILPPMAINNSRLDNLTFDDSLYITCENGFILVGDGNVSCETDGSWPPITCVEANCSAQDFLQPNNSKVSKTTDSATVFEFECYTGYTLVGNSSVSCISGNWSRFPVCEPVDCGPYGLIENGNVSSGTGTKYDDTVDIICSENYKLIGESQGLCLQNGSWTEKPVCMLLKCQIIILPDNAIIPLNVNETVIGTIISLACIDGYELNGTEMIQCHLNETWSEIPDCLIKDCGQPENIENSELIGFDKTTYDSTFAVKCKEGYNLKGESKLKCQSNGSWTEYPMCEIIDCGDIGELNNGTIVNQTGTSYGSTVFTICNDGFNLVGKQNLSCMASGKWDALPLCIKTDCGDYNIPEKASIGSNYEIICDEGYELIGDAKIECLNGSWIGNGTCQLIRCNELPQIENADIEPGGGNSFGDKLNISCKVGFKLSSSLNAECHVNKTWINVPTCNRISCGEYSFPSNANVSKTTTTKGFFEDTINITCLPGFDIVGKSYVYCNASGEWDNDPVCNAIACSRFQIPNHAKVSEGTNLDGFTYNQSITVACDIGYNISGKSVVKCGVDGQWDSTPLCQPVNCPDLELDSHTSIDRNATNFIYNDSVQFSCDEGYTLNGAAEINCTAQGSWTKIPSCEKVTCRTFEVPAHATTGEQPVTNLKYNDIINVTCNEGYIITDKTQARCGSDGEWKNIPSCQLVNCSILNVPENAILGNQDQDGHKYKDIVEINCTVGYILNGSSKVECLSNGNWSKLPTCMAKVCDSIELLDDGLIFPSKNDFFSNETISVTCAAGYELQGSKIATCDVNGTWSNLPKCIPNDCNPLDLPANAINLLNGTQFRYKENVTIKCNAGYRLSNTDTLSCQPNGTWADIPSCVPINCTTLDLPEKGMALPNRTQYLYNESITIICDDGYVLEGQDIISCKSNGTWQNVPDCLPVKCFPFETPNIASIVPDKQEYLYNESVALECKTGYEIEGESTVQCQSNSSWSNNPVCRPIKCDMLTLPENATTDSNVTTLRFDDEVSIKCQSNLRINISCSSNGSWSVIDCSSVDCSITKITLPEHSEIKVANESKSIYTVECNEGYNIVGNSSIQCLSGNWSNFPSCEIVECETGDLNSDTYTVDVEPNSTVTFNSSVSVACINGLELTGEAEGKFICGSDGTWQGNSECKIPGSIAVTKDPSDLYVNSNGTLTCEVRGNRQWQTVLLAKAGQSAEENSPIYIISNSTGSVESMPLNENYNITYNLEDDGVAISIDFKPLTCENEGNYICAVIVGDVENAIDTKLANITLEVSCTDCGKHKPVSDAYEVDANGYTTFNSTLSIRCIDGLVLTDDSDKVLTCGPDGTWQGNPKCEIPGSLAFMESSFAAKEGTALNITCTLADNSKWQGLMLGKASGDFGDTYSQIFMLSNESGTVESFNIIESYNVSYELHDDGVAVTMELDPVGCENRGTYACVAFVGDPENATVSKIATAQLNVSSNSVSPEITIPDRIFLDTEAKVECVGQIGKEISGEIEGQLLLETNFGENGSNLTYNSTSSPEDLECFFRESVSASIPTSSETEDLWAQCVIQLKQGDAISSETKTITVSKSFVAFENSSYVFSIGEKASLTCIVKDIPGWNRIEIKRSDGKIILGVDSDQQPDSYESHVNLLSNESSFSNDSAIVTISFDALNCSDTLDGVGEVEYICVVETNNTTKEDTATVTFQKKPGEPVLKLSREIIENKFTLGDRMFSCEGDVGNPPGSIEIQSNFKGTFETFLALMPGLDNNTAGWIVNNETDTSNCGNYRKLNFAFHNVTNDWQYKRLRCVIIPSDEIIGAKDELFDEKSINIIPDDICAGKVGFIPHPYFCYLNVECSHSGDGQINGVPIGCEENMCMTDANFCAECSAIGGCNITNVKCDKTSAAAVLGDTFTFTCNIQDFEEITYISINEVETVISETDQSVSVLVGIDATVTEENVILSFSNVSCSQTGDYQINLNNDTDVTLSVKVTSEPEDPTLSLPDLMTANQATLINCSGRIGRDEHGDRKASISLEYKFSDASQFTVYEDDGTRKTQDENCEIMETVTFSVTPSVAWNDSLVRCTTKNSDSSIVKHSSQERVILQTPGLFCNPMLLGSSLGESVTFNCALKDVQEITRLTISKNETEFINKNDSLTIPFEESADLPFTISIPSLKQLTFTFTSVECGQEGDYSININDELSATLTLRVLTSVAMLNFTKSTKNARLNERIEITCSGEVGRDIDGNADTQLVIEVKFEMESNFSIIDTNVETDPPILDGCVYSQEARLIFYPDISWNNSHVRCATRNESNIIASSDDEKLVFYSPNAYFQDTNITGILRETVSLTCIMKNMNSLTDILISKGDEREFIASHSAGSNKDSVIVLTNEIAEDGTSGTLEINITLSCGDDGIYYCRQNSSDTPSEAESLINIEWRAGTPVLDPSSDMVENSEPWAGAGFVTECTGELGTFQDASLYLESNLNGSFTKLTTNVNLQLPVKDLKMCTNTATVTFFTKFTSAWNGTILRCVVETEEEKLMDAEYVQIVPDNFCDNSTDGTVLDHPFDCRAKLTCGGDRKITAYREPSCGIEDCVIPGPSCSPCADVNKCRLDPLDVENEDP